MPVGLSCWPSSNNESHLWNSCSDPDTWCFVQIISFNATKGPQRERGNFIPILEKTLNVRVVRDHTLDHMGSYRWWSRSSGPGLPGSRGRKTPGLSVHSPHPDIQYCGTSIPGRMAPHPLLKSKAMFWACFHAAFTARGGRQRGRQAGGCRSMSGR